MLNVHSCPHLPHAHAEEEILILLSGEADLILPQRTNANPRLPMRQGDMVYYPAYFEHTLETTSDIPATYLMLKWQGRNAKARAPLGFAHFNLLKSIDQTEANSGFSTHLLFDGSTRYLKKLQCHTSTLLPGAGSPPHIDNHAVAMVILRGEVDTLGKSAQPNDVIFYQSGKPHGMHNAGKTPAKYVVFEFHRR